MIRHHPETIRADFGIEQVDYTRKDLSDARIAERDEALNQLDSARHSIDVLTARIAERDKRIAELEAELAEIRGSTMLAGESDYKFVFSNVADIKTTARNEAFEEAASACAEYKRGHSEEMQKHGKSEYNWICSDASDKCVDRIRALKTPEVKTDE